MGLSGSSPGVVNTLSDSKYSPSEYNEIIEKWKKYNEDHKNDYILSDNNDKITEKEWDEYWDENLEKTISMWENDEVFTYMKNFKGCTPKTQIDFLMIILYCDTNDELLRFIDTTEPYFNFKGCVFNKYLIRCLIQVIKSKLIQITYNTKEKPKYYLGNFFLTHPLSGKEKENEYHLRENIILTFALTQRNPMLFTGKLSILRDELDQRRPKKLNENELIFLETLILYIIAFEDPSVKKIPQLKKELKDLKETNFPDDAEGFDGFTRDGFTRNKNEKIKDLTLEIKYLKAVKNRVMDKLANYIFLQFPCLLRLLSRRRLYRIFYIIDYGFTNYTKFNTGERVKDKIVFTVNRKDEIASTKDESPYIYKHLNNLKLIMEKKWDDEIQINNPLIKSEKEVKEIFDEYLTFKIESEVEKISFLSKLLSEANNKEVKINNALLSHIISFTTPAKEKKIYITVNEKETNDILRCRGCFKAFGSSGR